MRYLKSRRGNSSFLFLHLQLFSDYYVFVLSDYYFSMRTSRRFYFKVLFTYLFCVWVYCLHVCLFSMFVKCPPGQGEELDLRYSNLLTTKSFLQSSRNFLVLYHAFDIYPLGTKLKKYFIEFNLPIGIHFPLGHHFSRGR